MLDNYLLEELVTFARTGTLAKTAADLNVTQPTVTRGMQKLEADLNVSLFDRQPNRLSLTPTGELAAKLAAKLLDDQQQAITKIQNFDRDQHVLKIGATIPGPLMVLDQLTAKPPVPITVNRKTLLTADPRDLLQHRDYTVILTNHAVTTPQIQSTLIGTESLAVYLNKFMYHANQKTVTFAELKGLSFLVLHDIGPWRDIIQQNIPDAKFLYQEQRAAFTELTQYSDFPYFSTNLSQFDSFFTQQDQANDNRVRRPISDASAQMTVYACYRQTEASRVRALLNQLREIWPKK